MKQYEKIIDENLNLILHLVQDGNILGAFRLSSSLTEFCTFADDDDGVLIMETLEGIFSQIGPIFDEYDISDQKKNHFISVFSSEFTNLIENYKNHDEVGIYNCLKNIRYFTTKYQLEHIRTGKKIKSNVPQPIKNLMEYFDEGE